MKFQLPSAIASRVANQSLLVQKHSPRILFVSGVALMGATVVSASRATLQLEDILIDVRKDQEDLRYVAEAKPEKYDDRTVKKLHAYINMRGIGRIVKLYLPSLALGVAAVGCLTSAHNILNRRNAGLSAALAATDRALKDYRGRVVEELGEDKDREFMFGNENEVVTTKNKNGSTKKETITRAGEGRSPYSRLWGRDTTNEWDPQPEYNLAKLRHVQQWGTMVLNHKGHLFLNEIFDELGLDRTPAGAVVGWLSEKNGGGDGYVDFGILSGDETEVRFLDFVTGHEDHILLDFNVDGEIWKDI